MQIEFLLWTKNIFPKELPLPGLSLGTLTDFHPIVVKADEEGYLPPDECVFGSWGGVSLPLRLTLKPWPKALPGQTNTVPLDGRNGRQIVTLNPFDGAVEPITDRVSALLASTVWNPYDTGSVGVDFQVPVCALND